MNLDIDFYENQSGICEVVHGGALAPPGPLLKRAIKWLKPNRTLEDH